MLLTNIILLIGALFQNKYIGKSKLYNTVESTNREFVVSTDSPKQRLDLYLTHLLPEYSRTFISDLIDEGNVVVNEKKRPKNYKISPHDKIEISIVSKEVSSVTPENIPLDILYEDEHILAINKPPGMVVHPAPGSPNGTFVNALLYYLGADASKLLLDANDSLEIFSIDDDEDDDVDKDYYDPETSYENLKTKMTESISTNQKMSSSSVSNVALRPGIVHRLDKGTSGKIFYHYFPSILIIFVY